MPNRFTSMVLKLAFGTSMLFLLAAGPAQAAQKVPATVRVVTTNGQILVDKELKTGTTEIKTSKGAECFGSGSSNGSTTVPGPTALGILGQASTVVPALRPLSITNASAFGLGVCGIGGFVNKPSGFWLLKHNHADSMTGGDSTVLKENDVVLWYLVKDFNEPTPAELFLQAPDEVKKGAVAKVRVFSYNSKGKRKPVEGAKLSVGGALSNAGGYTSVKVSGKTRIVARLAGTIPSNRVEIGIRK